MTLYTVHADDEYYPRPAFITADRTSHSTYESALESACQIMEDSWDDYVYIIELEDGQAPAVIAAWSIEHSYEGKVYLPCQEIILLPGCTKVSENPR